MGQNFSKPITYGFHLVCFRLLSGGSKYNLTHCRCPVFQFDSAKKIEHDANRNKRPIRPPAFLLSRLVFEL
jgi:hypothetical protein